MHCFRNVQEQPPTISTLSLFLKQQIESCMNPVKELHILNWNGNKTVVRYMSGFISCLSSRVQGKGLMKTYWVTGRKSANTFEEENQEILNPFQLSRQNLECHHALSPCSQNLLTPPTMRTRPVSPKPDEWPEADRRLSENRERKQSTPFPPSTGWTTEPVVARSRYSSFCDTMPQSRSSIVGDGPLLFPARSMSEFNILQVRNSICETLPVVPEASSSQLAVFAALADENARQARRLADWAAELARRAIRDANEEKEVHPEGTPVDPHFPRENESSGQAESTVEGKKKGGSGGDNTCSIM